MTSVDSEVRRVWLVLTIYCNCKTFPPEYPRHYRTASRRLNTVHQSAAVRQASAGLSVWANVQSAYANALRFPSLGRTIARYQIPDDSSLHVAHLIGIEEHLTVLGNLEELHSFLDPDWRYDLQ